ncbi:MAG: hypothetical protein NVSMB22_27040 [Chloroflexota bacterium]
MHKAEVPGHDEMDSRLVGCDARDRINILVGRADKEIRSFDSELNRLNVVGVERMGQVAITGPA